MHAVFWSIFYFIAIWVAVAGTKTNSSSTNYQAYTAAAVRTVSTFSNFCCRNISICIVLHFSGVLRVSIRCLHLGCNLSVFSTQSNKRNTSSLTTKSDEIMKYFNLYRSPSQITLEIFCTKLKILILYN